MNVRRAIAGATRSRSHTYPPRCLRGLTSNVATRACFKATIFYLPNVTRWLLLNEFLMNHHQFSLEERSTDYQYDLLSQEQPRAGLRAIVEHEQGIGHLRVSAGSIEISKQI